MEEVWIAVAEIAMEPCDQPEGDNLGFMNVIMWASSEADFLQKLEAYFARFNWTVLSLENARVVDRSNDYGDVVNRLIDETFCDKNRIGLGTFFSYRPN